MHLFSVFSGLIIFSMTSFASEQAPQSYAKTVGASYSELKDLYEAGRAPNQSVMVGSWIQVAEVTSEACRSSGGPSLAFDITGIKNNDKSVFTLEFALDGHKEKSFVESLNKAGLFVSLLNLGDMKTKQGPFKTAGETLQFSQWAYERDEQSAKDFYLYSCRLVGPTDTKIVCGVSLNLNSMRASNQKLKACADAGFSLLSGFQKVQ